MGLNGLLHQRKTFYAIVLLGVLSLASLAITVNGTTAAGGSTGYGGGKLGTPPMKTCCQDANNDCTDSPAGNYLNCQYGPCPADTCRENDANGWPDAPGPFDNCYEITCPDEKPGTECCSFWGRGFCTNNCDVTP